MASETITLGGGCFWCLEAVYQRVDGVLGVESGYAGGHLDDPDYHSVCAGTTGHAEVVQVEFDPGVIGLREILEIFFVIHDPTTLNRQGNDVGDQYRSAIYWHQEAQRAVVDAILEELTDTDAFDAPIVTEVAELDRFWPGEPYHQNYYRQNANQSYCQVVIAPKLATFRKHFADRLVGAADE